MELGRPVGSSKLRGKRFLVSYFENLEASGTPKEDQESPRSHRGAPKCLPRGSLEMHWKLFGFQKAPEHFPSHDPRYIHRFQGLQECCWRLPSHDLSILLAFWSIRRGSKGAAKSIEKGVSGRKSALRNTAHTTFEKKVISSKPLFFQRSVSKARSIAPADGL